MPLGFTGTSLSNAVFIGTKNYAIPQDPKLCLSAGGSVEDGIGLAVGLSSHSGIFTWHITG